MAALSVDLWLRGMISAGAVAFTLALVLRLNFLLSRMMVQFNGIMRNIGSIQNAAEMISQPIGLTDRPGAPDLVVREPEIRFEHIRFDYGKTSGLMEDLSLTIRPGEKVGIVGRSGAGKSTLVNLLLRFYDLEGGRILIDGQDIAGVRQESLRSQIGMVSQDTSLLNRSLRDNILFGRPDADETKLVEAARRAEAFDFIERLEDQRGRKGFDAHVGERGVKLSGGQRQRVAIARVMLKDAPILVLDEATSALDSEVEAAIQSNLDRLMQWQNRACHRPSPLHHRCPRPPSRHGSRTDHRGRHTRRIADARRALFRTLVSPVGWIPGARRGRRIIRISPCRHWLCSEMIDAPARPIDTCP